MNKAYLPVNLCNGTGIDPWPALDKAACIGCHACEPPSREEILTRMSQEWQCEQEVDRDPHTGYREYCGEPEWHPYSRRCQQHTRDDER